MRQEHYPSVEREIAFLRRLQRLRSKLAAHRKGSDYAQVLADEGVNPEPCGGPKCGRVRWPGTMRLHPGVPCVAFCTGCWCRWLAWLCARDARSILRSSCCATSSQSCTERTIGQRSLRRHHRQPDGRLDHPSRPQPLRASFQSVHPHPSTSARPCQPVRQRLRRDLLNRRSQDLAHPGSRPSGQRVRRTLDRHPAPRAL